MKQQKTRRAKTLFTLVALVVVLMSNVFVGRAEEPDPRILWVSDSSISLIKRFALFPNGNVLACNTKVIDVFGAENTYFFEIDGKTGKVIKKYPIITDYLKTQIVEQLDISDDGQYLALRGGYLYEFQTEKIYQFGHAGDVKFIPNTNILAYASWDDKDRNPSIVMLNIETKEKKTIYTKEENINRIAFSPDGKYMATGGTKETSGGDYYTVFKLWDAQKLTLIQELKRFDDRYNPHPIIKFSPDSKTLCINPGGSLLFFELNNFTLYQTIPINFDGKIGEVVTSFSFLNNEELIIQTQKLIFYNLITKEKKELFNFYNYGEFKFTPLKDKLIVLTHERKENLGPITALDLEKLLTNIEEKKSNDFRINYNNDTINISDLEVLTSNIKIEIFDIKGNSIKQFDLQINNTEISIPLKLPIGTYLINLTSGNKKLTSKFIVTK